MNSADYTAPSFVLYLLTALLYGAVACYFWRTRWTNSSATETTLPMTLTDRLLALVPLIAHTVLLNEAMFVGGLHFGMGVAILLILWLTMVIYWLGNIFYAIEGLQALITPVAAVCVLATAWLPPGHTLPNAEMPAFKLHLIISVLAYSLFTIASLHVVLMSLLEKRLHGGRLPAALQQLPPLLTMETLLFRILAVGFGFLTLTLISGIFFTEEVFGHALRFDHMTVLGILSWFFFGILIFGRAFYGWRGRIAMRWTLIGFLTLVLAYLGKEFVLEVILGRT